MWQAFAQAFAGCGKARFGLERKVERICSAVVGRSMLPAATGLRHFRAMTRPDHVVVDVLPGLQKRS